MHSGPEDCDGRGGPPAQAVIPESGVWTGVRSAIRGNDAGLATELALLTAIFASDGAVGAGTGAGAVLEVVVLVAVLVVPPPPPPTAPPEKTVVAGTVFGCCHRKPSS